MSSQYIICLDRLTGEDMGDKDINLFVTGYRYRSIDTNEDKVKLECYDSKESLSIPLELFQWMREADVLIEY